METPGQTEWREELRTLPLENKHSKRKGKNQEASWYQSVLMQVQDLV